MFDSSKDILYLILAFCILWITIFLSWLLFYLISIVRNTSKLLKEARLKYDLLEKGFLAIKEKLESSSTYLGLIAGAVKHLLLYIVEGKIEVKKKKKD